MTEGKITRLRLFYLLLMFQVIWLDLAGQSVPAGDDSASVTTDTLDFFEKEDLLQLSIKFDFDLIFGDKSESPEYQPAEIIYIDDRDTTVILSANIRTRGSFRLDPANCNFPPLKLRLRGKQSKGTIFQGVKELKMVTHCQDELEVYEQYLLQEYLIYRVFNVLTDYSFRVRLVRVNYIDTGELGRKLEKYAFFLEDKDDLAERLKGNILDVSVADPFGVDQDQYSLVSFFEFMIMNSDWSLPIVHNVEILSTDYFKPPYTIPYDFDWSKIIDIPYVVPGIGVRTEEGRVRVYKGSCHSRKDFNRIIEIYNRHRLDIYRLYLGFEPLDNRYKQQTYADYNDFYNLINDRELFRMNIKKECNKH